MCKFHVSVAEDAGIRRETAFICVNEISDDGFVKLVGKVEHLQRYFHTPCRFRRRIRITVRSVHDEVYSARLKSALSQQYGGNRAVDATAQGDKYTVIQGVSSRRGNALP